MFIKFWPVLDKMCGAQSCLRSVLRHTEITFSDSLILLGYTKAVHNSCTVFLINKNH